MIRSKDWILQSELLATNIKYTKYWVKTSKPKFLSSVGSHKY
jgi:hypothetical protein